MCRLVAAETSFYGIKKTRTHRANHRELSHCSKKNLVSRNELRETENIGATDLDELIANFLLQVSEFLFFVLRAEKFLLFDWLRADVFQLNLKYLHVKITVIMVIQNHQIISSHELRKNGGKISRF